MPPTLEKLQYLNYYDATVLVLNSDKIDASCGYGSDTAFPSIRSTEDMLLDALVFYLLSSMFNYVEQLQQASTLYILLT